MKATNDALRKGYGSFTHVTQLRVGEKFVVYEKSGAGKYFFI